MRAAPGRVRKYLKIMFWRIPAFHRRGRRLRHLAQRPALAGDLAASIPLPWMAVLIANDRPPRRAEEPRRYPDARCAPRSSRTPNIAPWNQASRTRNNAPPSQVKNAPADHDQRLSQYILKTPSRLPSSGV